MPNFALAVDIGATKAALGIVTEKFQILDKVEVPTGAGTEIWRDIEGASKSLLSKTDGNCIGVGIGSAGPLHLDDGQISPVNIPNWRKFPIVNKFASLVGTPNVVLHGDAMALAHAEYRLGAGQDANNMLGMVVSTGIGGGLILGGKLFTGVTGNASYFGHHTISFEGKQCTCGRIGCVETYASGPKMVEHAISIGWQSEKHDFRKLAEDARAGDKFAIQSIDRGTLALANAIVNVLGILDINTVVIGGGVSQAGDIYWNPLLEEIKDEAKYQNFLKDLEIMPAKLQRDAGLIGASLAISDYGVIYE